MKYALKPAILLVLVSLIALGWPSKALAAAPREIIIGDSFTLSDGETLDEDLLVIGGSVTLEKGSTLNGDILLLGGNLEVAGTVNGDITATGGYIELKAGAVIDGDITTTGVYLDRDPEAVIEGKVRSNEQAGPFQVEIPGAPTLPYVNVRVRPLVAALGVLVRATVGALLAMVTMMFFATQAERVARAVVNQPLIVGGLGLLTVVVLPIVLVALAITILLLPVSLVGFLLLVLAWAFGLFSLGLEVGKRFAQILNQEWHPALAAGLGTFLLILIADSTAAVIPCAGWLPRALIGILGLGAALLTGLGTSEYQTSPLPANPVAPPPSS